MRSTHSPNNSGSESSGAERVASDITQAKDRQPRVRHKRQIVTQNRKPGSSKRARLHRESSCEQAPATMTERRPVVPLHRSPMSSIVSLDAAVPSSCGSARTGEPTPTMQSRISSLGRRASGSNRGSDSERGGPPGVTNSEDCDEPTVAPTPADRSAWKRAAMPPRAPRKSYTPTWQMAHRAVQCGARRPSSSTSSDDQDPPP